MDRKVTLILANANKTAQDYVVMVMRQQRNCILKLLLKNHSFIGFIRSLKAYESSFEGSGNMMILKPDSDFFRFYASAKEINER